MNDNESQYQRDIHFSRKIRAGKRTYYFDVKSTRNNDYYLTITESKRLPGETEDRPIFEKHKLFLYKEDFEKFKDGFMETLDFIRTTNEGNHVPGAAQTENNTTPVHEGSTFTDVNFDDLGK